MLSLLAFVVAALALSQTMAYGQMPSSTSPWIGSGSVVFTANSSQPGFQTITSITNSSGQAVSSAHTEFVFEARISVNDSSFVVPTVFVETNKTSADKAKPAVNVSSWLVYQDTGSEPYVYDSRAGSSGKDGQTKSFTSSSPLPIGVPKGGSLGVVFETSGLHDGDKVKVTFVDMTSGGSMAHAEAVPVVKVEQTPLDVIENSVVETTGNGTLKINEAFSDPESSCEFCTRVEYLPNASAQATAAYAIKEEKAHLMDASRLAFWARGEEGGERLAIDAAGKSSDTISYANSTNVTLSKEWKRYEIDLPHSDLAGVTHLFGFKASGSEQQTFYFKGIVLE